MQIFRKIHPIKDFIYNLAQKEFRIFFTVFLTVTAGWIFFIVANNVSEGSTQEFDEQVIKLLRVPEDAGKSLFSDEITGAVRDITALGGGTVLFIITLSVTGFLLLRKDYHSVLLVLFAVIGGALLGFWLKDMFGRERPLLIYRLAHADSLSFPSGHSMMSAVVYLSLAVLVARTLVRRLMRVYVIVVALLLSLMIGLSRIYLGVHYPTDVLGGWTLGLTWAGFCWFLAYYTERRFKKE